MNKIKLQTKTSLENKITLGEGTFGLVNIIQFIL